MPRAPTVALAALMALAAACSSDSTLFVDLRTDLVPGEEFDGVSVRLDEGAPVESIARGSDDYLGGWRIAELSGVSNGAHALVVELIRDGATIITRPVRVQIDGDTAVTVVVTRDCTDVECTDDARGACLAGQCVDPSCTVENPAACPAPECATASDCMDGAACSAAACTEGVCLYGDDGSCGAGFYCAAETGCAPRRTGPMDAGMDTGPPDAGPPPVGTLIVDAVDPHWLEREGGDSVFLCGPAEPEYFFYRGTRNADGTRDGDQMDLINRASASGVNMIYSVLIGSHSGDGGNQANPFVDSDPALGLDDAILTQWETWLDAMDAAGIVAYLVLIDDDTTLYDGAAMTAEEEAVIRALVNRFERYPLILWGIRENFQEQITAPHVQAMARTIADADDFDHPIAVSSVQGSLAIGTANAEPAISHINYGRNATGAGLRADIIAYLSDEMRPLNAGLGLNSMLGVGDERRRNFWAIAMAGSYITIKDFDLEMAPDADMAACGRIVDFFARFELAGLAPSPTAPFGGTDYALASADGRYVLYRESSMMAPGISGLAAGSYALTYMDTQTGMIQTSAVMSAGGDVTFAVPVSLGQEVVVYVAPI